MAPWSISRSTYCPGHSAALSLPNTPRIVIVPDAVSTAELMKSSTPEAISSVVPLLNALTCRRLAGVEHRLEHLQIVLRQMEDHLDRIDLA